MATRLVDHALLDTNILLTATDEGRVGHQLALEALNLWPARGITCYTTGQVLREYLVVATRPAEVNGLGLSQGDALSNVSAFRRRLRFLDESEKVFDRLAELLGVVDCTGKQVHDANLIASCLAHGISTVVTQNVADFARFADRVRIRSLD